MNTIAAQLKEHQVPFSTLHQHYRPMLNLVKELIGVVPNCDLTLEIWPPGFRTYNLIVPNLLNLPGSLLGNKELKSSVGLGMYASSLAAGCPYCTAHTCSFAMRRGLDPTKIHSGRSPKEAAVVQVAERLSRVPHELTREQCDELSQHYSERESRWVLMGIAMMGFLNKFMDAMGIPLEEEALADTGKILDGTGWAPGYHVEGPYETPQNFVKPKTDNFGTYLRVLRQAPAAIKLENKWIRGVPKKYPEVGAYLEAQTGYSFPLLAHCQEGRVIRAIATVLRDNLDANTTKIGIDSKCLAGLVFARVVGNQRLADEAATLVGHHSSTLGRETADKVGELAMEYGKFDQQSSKQLITALVSMGLTKKQAASVVLAKAVSNSPAEVNKAVLQEVVPLLTAKEVVELVVWISVQQMLHRLYTYFEVSGTL